MKRAVRSSGMVCLLAAVLLPACSRATKVATAPGPVPAVEHGDGGNGNGHAETAADAMRRARAAVPASPARVQPATSLGTRIWREAVLSKGTRILVSTEARALWLMRDTVVLMSAPVAVGMSEGFTYAGKKYDFQTPLSKRRVISKATLPIWTPPDWHYFEIALEKELQVVNIVRGKRVTLSDGTRLEIRGNDVGRVNQFGNFWPFTPGTEIIFDGKIFVPPLDTRQRKIADVLGTHKLAMGDGYLIHGTNKDTSIGEAVSHGCVRMFNEDVARLFAMTPVGTPIYIF